VKSAGNDIVALASVSRDRTVQPNFYSKIISPLEQKVYNQSSLPGMPFENFVWLLWSIKESVYKYLQRIFPDLVFSPTKIIVQDIKVVHDEVGNSFECNIANSGFRYEFYTGKIVYGSNVLFFRSKISNEWIASIVDEDPNFEKVWWGVQSIEGVDYEHQSASVREFVLQRLASLLTGDLTIEKSEMGIPVVKKKSEALDLPVSLAHHGRFIAYAFSPPN
jgi:phosphopantetheine--protein transferase-like protein